MDTFCKLFFLTFLKVPIALYNILSHDDENPKNLQSYVPYGISARNQRLLSTNTCVLII